MKISKLSIIIPAYNEAKTIEQVLNKLEDIDLGAAKEIIVVNDASRDQTAEILEKYEDKFVILHHKKNMGKGAGMRTGIGRATGDYIITQDADLEYDPGDIKKLIEAAEQNDAKVVYGSRRLGRARKKNEKAGWSYYMGGVILTLITNLLYGTTITDEPTGYKMIAKEVLDKFNIESDGFEFCPEVTAKVSRLGYKIYEVPISYAPRSREDGKKIKPKDALIAVWTLIKYRWWRS